MANINTNPPLYPGERKNKNRSQDQNRGSVLVLALLIISILVVMVFEGLHTMQVNLASSSYLLHTVQAKTLLDSGLALARFSLQKDLQQDQDPADHYGEKWSHFLDPEQARNFSLDPEEIKGRLTDEQGKFPVNALVNGQGKVQEEYKQVLDRLLANPPFFQEDEQRQTIIQSLVDWLDKDNEPCGEFGAENEYYEQVAKPYSCKNGPLDCLDELLLVKGITPELYWGSGDNQPSELTPGPAKRHPLGLKDLLTIYGPGQININTAPKEVLAALVSSPVSADVAQDFAQAMLDFRTNQNHFDFLGQTDWYRNQLAGFNDLQLPAKLIAVQSNWFSLNLESNLNGQKKHLWAILKKTRQENKISIEIVKKKYY